MTDEGPQRYTPSDRLYLWLLTEPARPVPVGELNLLRATHGVSVRYRDSWLRNGFPLSEDLPLIGEEFLPAEKGAAAGAVDDARPDNMPSLPRTMFFLRGRPSVSSRCAMRVGEDEGDSTLVNALSMSRMFSLDRDAAIEQVHVVAQVVDRWKEHFRHMGVTDSDIDLYTEQIDRAFLKDQRSEFLSA